MNNNQDNYDYSFRILHEQVSSNDLFEDKTHQKIADTLENLISNSEQGVTVGLEGGWGSGKSTVINLLKQKLDESNTLFFVFDAWAHDGDPLRKIFLEKLINFINPEDDDEKLHDLKNKVSARTKSIEVTTEKSASKLGKLLSGSALFIPIGAALLSATNFDNFVMPWSNNAGSPSFSFWSGLFFSFMPLLVLIYWLMRGEKNEQGKKKWDIFDSNSTEKYTQDVTEDGERTSIEFEKFFNQILSHIFDSGSKYQYKKAIIIIDNLDRVDPEYAQSIWSTLQTFFQHRSSFLGSTNSTWRKKLWFLIPYDRAGIHKIWTDEEKTDNTSNSVASSFMEKCFQVTLEVPSPVMSAWIDYFKSCINKAFIGWPEVAKNEFAESYVQCMSKLETSPTPRQIHTFVNKAGVLALQWKGEFSPEALSLYSLYRQDFTESEFRTELLKSDLPKSYTAINAEKNGTEQLKAELSGLLFGVTAEKGMQLLLVPEIKRALQAGGGERLKELSEIHQDAFWLAWRASSNEWLPTESHVEEYKINTTSAIHDAFVDSKEKIRSYIDHLTRIFMESFDKWELLNFSYCDSITHLIKLSNNSKFIIQELRTKLQKKVRDIVNLIDDPTFLQGELISISELINLLDDNNASLKTYNYKKLNADNWKIWLDYCQESEVSFSTVLPAKETFDDLIINSQFNSSIINKEWFSYLTRTYILCDEISVWANLPDAIIRWLDLNNREIDENNDAIYSLLLKLHSRMNEEQKKLIHNCVKGAPFWSRGAHENIEDTPALPYLVAIGDTDFLNNPYVSDTVKKFFDREFRLRDLQDAYNYFKMANAISTIWELASKEGYYFATEIIHNIDEPKLFSTGAMYVDDIKWDTDEKESEIVKKLCKQNAFDEIYDDISDDVHAYHDIIYMIMRFGDTKTKDKILHLLDSLTKEQWKIALQGEDSFLQCIPERNRNFGEAWSEYIKDIIQGNVKNPTDVSKIIRLKDKVLDLKRVELPSILSAYFIKPEEDHLTDDQFDEISSLIGFDLTLISRNDYEIRLIYWLENNQEERVKWLLKADYNSSETPLERTKAVVLNKLKSSDSIELYTEINEKLKLKIDIQEELNKLGEATEATEATVSA